MGRAHAAPATASDGFDHDRVTDPFGDRQGFLFILDHTVRTGRGGDAGFLSQRAADGLVLERVHRTRTGADETDIATLANVREMGVLGKKPVAGVNGVNVRDLGGTDDAVDAEVAFVRGRFADAN